MFFHVLPDFFDIDFWMIPWRCFFLFFPDFRMFLDLKWSRAVPVRASQEHLKSIPAPWWPFGSLLAHFGSLWLPFGSLLFWLPLTPFWLPFAPSGHHFAPFHRFGSRSAPLCIHFTHSGPSPCTVSSKIMFLGHPSPRITCRWSFAPRPHANYRLHPSFPKGPERNFAAGNLDPLWARRRPGRVRVRPRFPLPACTLSWHFSSHFPFSISLT